MSKHSKGRKTKSDVKSEQNQEEKKFSSKSRPASKPSKGVGNAEPNQHGTPRSEFDRDKFSRGANSPEVYK
jgi:hypothetical protein